MEHETRGQDAQSVTVDADLENQLWVSILISAILRDLNSWKQL